MPNLQTEVAWSPGKRIKCLVYGRFKTGKTFGAGTFPRPNVLDFDRGIGTLANPDWRAKYGNRSIEYKQFTETDKTAAGVVKVAKALDDASRYFDEWMRPGKRDQFDTWILDSGTSLSQMAQNKAIMLMGDKSFTGPKVMSVTHASAMRHGMVFPKIQDYGAERSIVDQFVQMILDTDKHFVFICHEKELTNDDGATTAIVPLLTGKGVDEISLKFDEVYNLRIRKVGPSMVRELLTEPDGIRYVGSRAGVPTGTLWDYDSVVAALTKRYDEVNQIIAREVRAS